MAAVYQTRFILQAMLVVVACVVSAGCQSFELASAESQSVETSKVIPDANVVGQYQMQLIPSRGKPSVEKINITSPVTVQDALVASGATKKFGLMRISLGRIIKENGTLLKLPVEYNVRSKSVRPEQNYEILPGDTITVSPKKSDAIERILKTASGGLI